MTCGNITVHIYQRVLPSNAILLLVLTAMLVSPKIFGLTDQAVSLR